MLQQKTAPALTTEQMLLALDGRGRCDKLSAWDATLTAGLAALAVGACGLVHVVAGLCI